jgi:hypothetical protein|tara:strand:- start:241 stop:444 length:204 start_codon:yes stop_codon:yes gene_type:complete
MRELILKAMKLKYEGIMAECSANIEIYLRNAAGIGEHSEVLESLDLQIEKLASAEEKLKTLGYFKNG